MKVFCFRAALVLGWFGAQASGQARVQELAPNVDLLNADASEAIQTQVGSDYSGALWPGPEECVGEQLPLKSIDPHVIKEAGAAIRAVLREGLVPDDLEERFIARRVRMWPGSRWIADTFLVRYAVEGWNVQIREAASFVDVLVSPAESTSVGSAGEYVLAVARKVLRVSEPAASQLVASSVCIGGSSIPGVPQDRLRETPTTGGGNLHYGVLRYRPYDEAWHSNKPDRPKDAWLGQIFAMTNGHWAYFAIRETNKPPGRPQARPGPRPRFPATGPWAPIPSNEPPPPLTESTPLRKAIHLPSEPSSQQAP